MAPSQSTLRNPRRGDYQEKIARTYGSELYYNAPIPFAKREKEEGSKGDASSDEEKDKHTVTFVVKLNPGDDNSDEYRTRMKRFQEGRPEEYCHWRTGMDRLRVEKGLLGDVMGFFKLLKAALGGRTLAFLEKAFTKRQSANQALRANQRLDLSIVLLQALNDLSYNVFASTGEDSVRNQKRYLKNSVRMGSMMPSDFANRLEEINDYIKYFPVQQVR